MFVYKDIVNRSAWAVGDSCCEVYYTL